MLKLEDVLSREQTTEAKQGVDALKAVAREAFRRDGSNITPEQSDEFILATTEWIRKHLDAKAAEVVDRVKESVRVCCFCENSKSTLMWSHYADSHRGFCIEYPMGNLPPADLRRRLLFPVVYSHVLFDATSILERGVAGGFNNLFPLATCLQKNVDWSYEKEWRLIFAGGVVKDASPITMPVPSAIYLGVKMEQSDRAQVRQIARKHGSQLFRMKLTNTGGLELSAEDA